MYSWTKSFLSFFFFVFFFASGITAGTMDEVLASLQRGQIKLRKVPDATNNSGLDARSSLMSAIREGVKLKKVRCLHSHQWYFTADVLYQSDKFDAMLNCTYRYRAAVFYERALLNWPKWKTLKFSTDQCVNVSWKSQYIYS